jgi:2-polyprenyl-3-methyl-5-hydroxy-6-metoxy-1,4-benzoquinol methylase
MQCYSHGGIGSNDSNAALCDHSGMFDWVHNRRIRGHEFLDEDDVDPRELERALGYIRRVNSALGYTRSIIAHLKRFSRNWKPGERIDIIDLATGSADIPRAILGWAAASNFDVHIVGVDRHAVTARVAAAQGDDSRLQIVQADVFALPFADHSFDYALTALFLHHLDEDGIVSVLKSMDRLCRRGIIAADILRRRRAYFWINLLTLFSSRMVRHDATVSVAQALSDPEILSLRDRAGISYATLHHHFGHRFVLSGEKSPSQ